MVVRSSTAIWARSRPSAVRKVPVATSLVPSGEMSKWATRRVPWRLVAKFTFSFGSSAPVLTSTAASRPRATPSIDENAPPMYRSFPSTCESSTQLPTLTAALKLVSIEPSERFSLTRRFAATPFTVANSPPTNTAWPPGATEIVLTSPPSMSGMKFVSIAPVWESNATISWTAVVVVAFFCFTVVNVPPTIIRLPACATAFTWPSWMFGVKLAGLADTTTDWAASVASAAGTAASAARTMRAGSPARIRRNMRLPRVFHRGRGSVDGTR